MISTAITSANAYINADEINVKGEEVTYTSNGTTLKGYIAYDENKKEKDQQYL